MGSHYGAHYEAVTAADAYDSGFFYADGRCAARPSSIFTRGSSPSISARPSINLNSMYFEKHSMVTESLPA